MPLTPEYLGTLARLIKDAQQPGWYPCISYHALNQQRDQWVSSPPATDIPIGDAIAQERENVAPLSKAIAARLGDKFSVGPERAFWIRYQDGLDVYFLWCFQDHFWQELARKERNYRMAVLLGIPKQGTAVARFRNSALYERQLWRVILKYADVPERFI